MLNGHGKIRAWLEGNSIFAHTAGRLWHLRTAGSLDDLWDAMTPADFEDEKIPYWAELWPASLALAEWLRVNENEIAGQFCIDLGCGLGLTAIAARALGARVLAMDNDLPALKYCRENARLNNVPAPLTAQMDWRNPAVRPRVARRIFAGDIIYEKRFMEPVCDFLEFSLASGGRAWIAEPGRKIFTAFLDILSKRRWGSAPVYSMALPALRPQKSLINVRIWEIKRDAIAEEAWEN